MQYLDIEELLFLHYKIVEDFGGSHGVKDEGRLESALATPKQVVFGQELYKSIHEKAAVYLRSLIADHPFVDGNKRTAITVAGVFLQRNGYMLNAPPKQLEDFAVRVAIDHLDVPVIATWLRTYTKRK